MDDEDEEAETDAIVNQVLDEIGISLTQEVRRQIAFSNELLTLML